jgi:hypothetical protein
MLQSESLTVNYYFLRFSLLENLVQLLCFDLGRVASRILHSTSSFLHPAHIHETSSIYFASLEIGRDKTIRGRAFTYQFLPFGKITELLARGWSLFELMARGRVRCRREVKIVDEGDLRIEYEVLGRTKDGRSASSRRCRAQPPTLRLRFSILQDGHRISTKRNSRRSPSPSNKKAWKRIDM